MKDLNYVHHVYTNFGVGIFDEIWLVNRLELFRNTTFYSINNQTNQSFKWFVFIHTNLPAVFKARLFDIVDDCKVEVIIIEVSDYSLISSEIEKIKLKEDVDYLLTSRIDDDDITSHHAIDKIQNQFFKGLKKYEVQLIALSNGVEYYPEIQLASPMESQSIAILLTLSSKKDNGKFHSINHFAHHSIVDVLSERGIKCNYTALKSRKPLYAYVKHRLSDSFYAGAKARAIKNEHSFKVNEAKICDFFSLDKTTFKNLHSIVSEMPNGVPHKYLQKLNELRNVIKIKTRNGEDFGKESSELEAYQSKATRKRYWSVFKRKKIKVAVLGSCVTRDLFEFNPELKEKFELVFYNARSSIISYMSGPIMDRNIRFEKDGFEERCSTNDIFKLHWKILHEVKPDIVITDFIDERIGLINLGGGYVSASGPMINYLESEAESFEILRPWNPIIKRLRENLTEQFMYRLSGVTDNIILHKAAWSSEQIVNGGIESVDLEKWGTLQRLNNEILVKMFTDIENCPVTIDSIGGEEIGMYSGGEHRWEYSPFHYDKSYYKSLSKQLLTRVD